MKVVVWMRRRLCSVSAGLWLVLACILAGPAAAEPALWRVDSGPRPVWLFGTFHLLPPETEWQSPGLDAAFDEADVLAVEVRMDDAAIAAAQKVIAQKAFIGDGRKLRDVLTPEDQAVYERVGTRLGLYPAILDNYRPWYASILLAVALYYEQGFRAQAGVDTVLQKRAEAAGKAVEQFETAVEQMNFLADMSDQAQIAMLQATLREAGTVPEQIDTMLEAWQSGDAEAMNALFNVPMRQFPEAYDRLLVQRNRNWLPRVEAMIADDRSYFIAVGTAHLIGEDSVVELLREAGYEVTGP